MRDPDREEIEEVIRKEFPAESCDEFDKKQAIYWFANDWHGGQGSNLYSILSTSEYHPGPLERGPDSVGKMIYDFLEEMCS